MDDGGLSRHVLRRVFVLGIVGVAPEEAAGVFKSATEASAGEPTRGAGLTTIRDLGAVLATALQPYTKLFTRARASTMLSSMLQ